MLAVDPSDGSAKATEGVAFGVIVIIFDDTARVPCTVAKFPFGKLLGGKEAKPDPFNINPCTAPELLL
jgi:hypothetical protein